MKRYCGKIIKHYLVIIGAIILNVPSPIWAQGPFGYDTPLGYEIYNYSDNPVSTQTVLANDWGSKASNYDGLTVVSWMIVDQKDGTELFNFYNGNNENILKIIYNKGTLVFQRERPRGSVGNFNSYDYILYDRMFDSNYGLWEIRIYFTANFFWIQTTPIESGAGQKSYLSPIFFGLNNSLQDNMSQYIQPNSGNTRIVVGNASVPNGVNQVKVYAFKYDDLRKDIQEKFCDPFNFAIGEDDMEY